MIFPTVSKMFNQITIDHLNRPLYYYKKLDKWQGLSGSEIRSTVKDVSFALKSMEIGSGDTVAILSNNSPWWAMSDYGIICSGAASVSIYPTLIPSQIEYILNDSKAKAIFVENNEQLAKIEKIWSNCSSLQCVVIMDDSYKKESKRIMNFSKILDIGTAEEVKTDGNFEDLIATAQPNDLLTLIYTSGTTGNPKGVMLTHENMMANVDGISESITFDHNEIFLSFLPLSHVFERMGGHFNAFSVGATVYYAESIEKVPQNLQEVKPSVVLSVPRLYEKMYNKVLDGLKTAPKIRQNIFWWAINLGKIATKYRLAKKSFPFIFGIKHSIADKLVYSKVKEKVGGRLRFFVSGGAPLSKEIAEFFAAVDVTILEGYGLTETSPVLTANTPEAVKFGSVGKPLFNVKIKIADDGEILAKGPSIMKGYYNKEEATKESIDSDGWFHTGDIGNIDEEGFLTITDRKKNILITSGGKNVAPAPLENSMVTSPYIEQSIVIGDKRNYISALVVPAFETIQTYLDSKGKSIANKDDIVKDSDVVSLIESEVERAMEVFSNYEKVKKIALIPNVLSIDNGELTPTLKVVRKVVLERYSVYVDKLYEEEK